MKKFAGLILLLSLLLVYPAVAQANSYQKIVVISFSYSGTGIKEVSSEIQYGIPPNLNIQTGSIKGLLLDGQNRIINEFSIRDPSTQVGEAISTETSGQVFSGSSQYSQNGNFGVIVPFTPDLRYVFLEDTATGDTLVTVDLSPAISAFQQIYPEDPDMQVVQNQAGSQNSGFTAVILLISGIIIIGISGLAYYTLSFRHLPEKILIVDDEKDIVEVFSLLLEKKGYVTLRAFSGQECLSILKAWWKRPDLILLDVKMYPMDGWETLEEIKKNPLTKKIPVLMLTGFAPTPAQARRYGLCIDDYILKPVNAQELYSEIEYVLKRRELIKQDIRAATTAGYEKEMLCEYARLRKRVEVDRKLLGILRADHSATESVQDGLTGDIDTVNREIKSREEMLNQLRRKLAPVISPQL